MIGTGRDSATDVTSLLDDFRPGPAVVTGFAVLGLATARLAACAAAAGAARDRLTDGRGARRRAVAHPGVSSGAMPVPRDVAIRGDTIRLGQLLKLAGVVGGGGELKAFLAATPVLVNGEPDLRRGRQLHPGDVVAVADEELRVVSA